LKKKYDDLDSFHGRVAYVRRQMGLKQKEFAELLKTSSQSISRIESGQMKPGYDFFFHLDRDTDINASFLFTGEGKPFKLKGIIERIDLEDKDVAEFLKYFVSSEYTKFYTLAEFKRFYAEKKTYIEKDCRLSLESREKEEENEDE
jgi:transcriptional regulator with XRE-family HTH domain